MPKLNMGRATSSNGDEFSNTFWIIRTAGERTAGVCYALINSFVPEERISIVHERPFTKALQVGYERGIEAGYKWTVVIDADVYVHRSGFAKLIAVAEEEPRTTSFIQGLTIDKFIPIIRTAGTRIFRTCELGATIKGIPHGQTPLRPETEAIERAMRKGHGFYRTDIIVGIHDFDQRYQDIMRKAYLHVRKHANALDSMIRYWRQNQGTDADFRAALLGYEISRNSEAAAEVDWEFKQAEFAAKLRDAQLAEKPALENDARSPEWVGQFIRKYEPDLTVQRLKFPQYDKSYYLNVNGGKWEKRLSTLYFRFRRLALAGQV